MAIWTKGTKHSATWTKGTRNTASWSKYNKSLTFTGSILTEAGFYLLLETGGKILLEQATATYPTWTKATKH